MIDQVRRRPHTPQANIRLIDLADEDTVQRAIAGIVSFTGQTSQHDRDVARGYALAVLAGLARSAHTLNEHPVN